MSRLMRFLNRFKSDAVVVRRATHIDLVTISTMDLARAIEDKEIVSYDALDRTINAMLDAMSSLDHVVYVATINEEVVGMVVFRLEEYSLQNSGLCLSAGSFYIEPAYRSSPRVAMSIYRQCVLHAHHWGVSYIRLQTHEDNASRAKLFKETLGASLERTELTFVLNLEA